MIASVLAPLAQGDWDGHMDWGDGWWVLIALGMVLYWGLVIFAVVWVVRELGARRSFGRRTVATVPLTLGVVYLYSARRPDRDDPLGILDRRLAEGAISAEDYRERRSILDGTTDSTPVSDEM